jgi:hypothetical protein
MLTLENVARALAGEIVGDEVRVPGPGHSAKDRSLCVKLDRAAPGGFIVNSFAGDDPIRCKDYVREKLGLPSWNESHDGNRLVATYDYTDEGETLLFQVVRFTP